MIRKLKIQFYRDKKREWRWRIKSGAKVLADSGEGYKRLASAVKGLNANYPVSGLVWYTAFRAVEICHWAIGHYTVEVIR